MEASIRRFSNVNERELLSVKNKLYFKNHPEAARKHSEDIKGRIYVYLSSGSFKMLKPEFIEEFLKSNLDAYLKDASKKKYEKWKNE